MFLFTTETRRARSSDVEPPRRQGREGRQFVSVFKSQFEFLGVLGALAVQFLFRSQCSPCLRGSKSLTQSPAAAKDSDGNASNAEALVSVGAMNNYIDVDEGTVVGIVGVEGLAVVQSGDRLLVCPIDQAQEVKQIVDELKNRQ